LGGCGVGLGSLFDGDHDGGVVDKLEEQIKCGGEVVVKIFGPFGGDHGEIEDDKLLAFFVLVIEDVFEFTLLGEDEV
jgi:hypothetical protein